MLRIVHMTSVHPWHDTRIFVKMCRSLAEAGHEVHLVAPMDTGLHGTTRDRVRLHAVPLPSSRLQRMRRTVREVIELAESLKGDVYHLHDPEFLRVASAFQERVDRPVIYDAHEDVRLAVLDRKWLPWGTRRIVSWWVGQTEDRVVRHLSGVIAATPAIAERFRSHPFLAVVQNYPIIGELAPTAGEAAPAERSLFAYVGGISEERGIRVVIDALGSTGSDIRLGLAGLWESSGLERQMQNGPGWAQVENLGYLSREELGQFLSSAVAGVVLFQSLANHIRSQPNKLFEYMSAGLPVVASDFPLWRSIVEENRCGLVVDPSDPGKVAEALRWVVDHPDEARSMGSQGQEAVSSKYNWGREFPKLVELYRAVSS